jgi:RNA polymerase sigma-70 factor, ECF subfamily
LGHPGTKIVSANVAEQDDDLIEGCRRRDPDAQHRLFCIYKDRVYSMALFLCRNSADAAEITQEVFVKVFLNLDQFVGDSKFETWLYRIVTNAVSDYGRKLRRRFLHEHLFWRHQKNLVPSMEEKRAESQIEETVRSAVASLPEKFRVCVVLRYVEDLSYQEIAALLGCPPGTVAARLSRAHRILALKLTKVKR